MTQKRRSQKEVISPKGRKYRKQHPKNLPWQWIGLGILILAVGIFALVIAGVWRGLPGEVSPERAYQMVQDGAFVLDVREPDEWDQAHIPNSVLIPLGDLANHLNDLPHDRDILVVCRTGRRSAEGRDLLQKSGFERVTSLSGGLVAWRQEGYPVVSGSP